VLGQRFNLTIIDLLEEVSELTERYRFIVGPARRHFRMPFPYAIIYIDRTDFVWVIEGALFKREPGYWKHRLE
jgi:hypothetical protein